ncbi:MAG: CHAT domain-containing tetratricopeptide repeat protein, partial [Acidobacteriota bacterium]
MITRVARVASIVAGLATLSIWSPAHGQGQIGGLFPQPGAMTLPQLDPTKMQQQLQAELDACKNTPDTADAYQVAGCKTLEAITAMSLGQLEAGRSSFQEALDRLGTVGDDLAKAITYHMVAQAETMTQHPENAVVAYRRGLATIEQLRTSGKPISLRGLGFFMRLSGMQPEMLQQMEPMLVIVGPMILNQFELLLRDSYAVLLTARRDFDAAESQFETALILSRSLWNLMDAQVLGHFATLREHQQRWRDAQELYRRAIAATQMTGDTARRSDLEQRLTSVTQRLSRDQPPEPHKAPQPSSKEPAQIPGAADSASSSAGPGAPPKPHSQAPAAEGSVTHRLPPAGGFPMLGSSSGLPPLLRSGPGGLLDFDEELINQHFRRENDQCAAGSSPSSAWCLFIQGVEKADEGRLAEGIADFEASLRALDASGDRSGSILIRTFIASNLVTLGQHDRAATLYAEVLETLAAPAGASESAGLGLFGDIAQWLGIPAEYLPDPAQGGNRVRPLLELVTRDGLGMALAAAGRFPEAENELHKATLLAGSFMGLMDAQVYDHYAQVVALQKRLPEARRLYDRALEAATRMGEMGLRLDILRRLTELERVQGRTAEAHRFNQLAFEQAQRRGRATNQAKVLVDRINLFFDRGDMKEARAAAQQALQAAEASGDAFTEALVRTTDGMLATSSGDYERALISFEHAYAVLNNAGSDHPRAAQLKVVCSTSIGGVYFLLGRPERLEEKLNLAREIAEESGDPLALAWSAFAQQWDRSREAWPNTDSALLERDINELLRTMGQSRGLYTRSLALQSSLLEVMPAITRFDEAAEAELRKWLKDPSDANRSAAGPGAFKAPWERAAAVILMAMRLSGQGSMQEALNLLNELRQRTKEWQLHEIEAQTVAMTMMVQWLNGQLPEAAATGREAIAMLDELTGNIQVDNLLASLFSDRYYRFYQIATLLMAIEGETHDAFMTAERARARALLHMLGNQRLDLRGQGDSSLLADLDQLRAEILALERNQPNSPELLRKRQQFESRQVEIKLERPEYQELTSVKPIVSVEALQQDVLPPETTLISYFIAPDRILAWIVDRQQLEQVTLPISDADRPELSCLAGELGHGRARGSQRLSGCLSLTHLTEKYYQKLIEPVLPYVHHQRVILVPHGILHYVPFAALRKAPDQPYFGESNIISYTPSVSALSFLGNKTSPFDGRALVIGNPEIDDPGLDNLTAAAEEARAVAKLFDTEALIGAAATESRVHQAAGEIDLLHLAAHGVYKPRAPRFSRIVLARDATQDGLLEVEEVFSGLDLEGVNLVVLSACQTALGERNEGDEIIGLTRAFLYAGSPAVVSTLWNVDDQATAFLMTTFY